MIECMDELETTMCYVDKHSDIWQNRVIYVLCKAVYLLLKRAVKGEKK